MSSSSISAASPADREPLLQGRYRIKQCLGSGGMGDVHLAEDTRLGRLVAIKSIKREFCKMEEVRKRIERECVMHAQLGAHPNIIPLYDRVEEDGQIHLVMEYVDGVSLKDQIDRARSGELQISWRESVSIACQVLDALARIHALGIVHRDVKPANVMIVQNDTGHYIAKLMDFGIARLMNPVDGATMLTRQGGSGPGTPLYMSPEQIAGTQYGPLSPASDIYAMGVMLYQMLTGHAPFQGTITEIFHGHLSVPPPPVDIPDSTYPQVLTEIIHKAMAKHPSERFATASEFRYWLRVVVKSRGPITSLALKGEGPATTNDPNLGATVPLTPVTPVVETPGANLLQRRHEGAKSARRMVALAAIVLLAIGSAVSANLYFFRGEKPVPAEPTSPLAPTTATTAEPAVGPSLDNSPVFATPVVADASAPVSDLSPSLPAAQTDSVPMEPATPTPAPEPVVVPNANEPEVPASEPVVVQTANEPDPPAPEPKAERSTPKSAPEKKVTPPTEPDLVTPEDEVTETRSEPEMRRTPVPIQTPVPRYSAPAPRPYAPPSAQTPVPPANPPAYGGPQSSSQRAADMFKDMPVNKLPSTRVN